MSRQLKPVKGGHFWWGVLLALSGFAAISRAEEPPISPAEAYQKGATMPRGPEQMRYFETACNGNNGPGCNALGEAYESGTDVAQNYPMAASLYAKACENKAPQGCKNAAQLFRYGRGVAKDPAKAIAFLDKGCRADHADSCNAHGYLLFNGEGVAKDVSAAVGLYGKACTLGSQPGCDNLARGRSVLAAVEQEQKAAKLAAAVKAEEDKKAAKLAAATKAEVDKKAAKLAALSQKTDAAASGAHTPDKFERMFLTQYGKPSWDPNERKNSTTDPSRLSFSTIDCSPYYLYLAGSAGVNDPQYQAQLSHAFGKASKGWPGAEYSHPAIKTKSGWRDFPFRFSREEAMSRDQEMAAMLQRKAPLGSIRMVASDFGVAINYPEISGIIMSAKLENCEYTTGVYPPKNAFTLGLSEKDYAAMRQTRREQANAYAAAARQEKATKEEEIRQREIRLEERSRRLAEEEARRQANAVQNSPAPSMGNPSLQQQCAEEWARLEEARKLSKQRGVMPTTEYFNRLQRYAQICK